MLLKTLWTGVDLRPPDMGFKPVITDYGDRRLPV